MIMRHSIKEFIERIKYDPGTIREHLKGSALFGRTHYIRPVGGGKILYPWTLGSFEFRRSFPNSSNGEEFSSKVSAALGEYDETPLLKRRYGSASERLLKTNFIEPVAANENAMVGGEA